MRAQRGGGLSGILPPPPVDTDFFDIAGRIEGHQTQKLSQRVLKSVWELYGETSGVSLERYYRDIETRAAIGRFAKTANQPKDWRKRQTDLEELIRRVYVHTTCDTSQSPTGPRESKVHMDILRNLEKGDTVITFNYDLLIEESFEKGQWSPVNGYGVKVQGINFAWARAWFQKRGDPKMSSAESKVLLLKLHGSLNWSLYDNRQIRLKNTPYLVSSRNGKPRSEDISVLPPGWNKRIDQNPYRVFWREARLRLEKCKTLVVLGYSLPETDLLAHALFSEIVRSRKARGNYLKELHLSDPSESVKTKFTKLFTPALGPLGRVFKYQDVKELSIFFSTKKEKGI